MRRRFCALLLLAGLLSVPMTAPGASADPAEAFPGTNGSIAFTSLDDGYYQIFAMDADGSDQVNLTNSASHNRDSAYSPDGERIAFDTTRDGNIEVYVMDADGSNPVNLTNDPTADDISPTWSPDGSKIAFVSNRDGDHEVYVMDADGSNAVNLTNDATADDISPAWSPDGSKIAFTTTLSGEHDVWLMGADGSNPTNLTEEAGDGRTPSWSPDGSRIAFQSSRDGNEEVYVMDADGVNPVNLTAHPTSDSAPSWSPDGTAIAFQTDRLGDFDVYRMVADGSSPLTLSGVPTSHEYDPDWQSVPLPGDVFQPDGRIRRGATGAQVGNDVYNMTGSGQSRAGSAARGRTVTYYASIQNDGTANDSFLLGGGGSSPNFRVQYFRGSANITSSVVARARYTPYLAPGGSYLVRIVVTVKQSAPRGAALRRQLSADSTSGIVDFDTVAFLTRRA